MLVILDLMSFNELVLAQISKLIGRPHLDLWKSIGRSLSR